MAMWDSFGFQLGPLSSTELSARDVSARSQTKCAALWNGVGSNNVLSMKPQSLKSLIRKGVPCEVRPVLWLALSGGAARKLAAGEHEYKQLSSSVISLPDDVLFNVEKDVSNIWASFKQHRLFQGSKGREALSRVLMALAQRNPDIGYPRGLHHVAGLLLVVMGAGREEEVFYTLAALLEDKLFPFCNGQVELGSRVELGVLERLVQKKLPHIAKHLAQLQVELTTITGTWFSSLFSSALPPETLVRVWDCLFCEGSKVLHRVALALLKRHESTVLSCSQPDIMKKVLDLRISRSYDADELLSIAFHGIGSLSGATLASLRTAALARPPLIRHFVPRERPPKPAALDLASVYSSSPGVHLAAAAAAAAAAANGTSDPQAYRRCTLQVSRSLNSLRPSVGWAATILEDDELAAERVMRDPPRRSSR